MLERCAARPLAADCQLPVDGSSTNAATKGRVFIASWNGKAPWHHARPLRDATSEGVWSVEDAHLDADVFQSAHGPHDIDRSISRGLCGVLLCCCAAVQSISSVAHGPPTPFALFASPPSNPS